MMNGILLSAAEGATSPTAFQNVMDSAKELVTWGGELFNVILANPILVVFVAASFVSIGLGIVRKLKRTAR